MADESDSGESMPLMSLPGTLILNRTVIGSPQVTQRSPLVRKHHRHKIANELIASVIKYHLGVTAVLERIHANSIPTAARALLSVPPISSVTHSDNRRDTTATESPVSCSLDFRFFIFSPLFNNTPQPSTNLAKYVPYLKMSRHVAGRDWVISAYGPRLDLGLQ